MRWVALAVACSLGCAAAIADTLNQRALEPIRSQRKLEVGIHEGVPWPLVNAPIDGPLPDAPRSTEPRPKPPTRAGAKVIEILDGIKQSLHDSSYQPRTQVKTDEGIYRWDCSGMAAWILRRSAPKALANLASSRPVARDFVSAIERAPLDRARNGWQRLRVADVMPGDLFAWRRPRGMPSKNTGHVGFVVEKPLPVPEIPGAWAVRIADSTRGYHQDDARSTDEDGGFGIGTLVFLTDADGNATHYGWSGTLSEWYITTSVVFGRVHH
jgi:hypothetical protein